MNFGFLKVPWFGVYPRRDSELTLASTSTLLEQPKQEASFEIRLWGWTLVSVPPCGADSTNKIRVPTTINKGLKTRAQQRGAFEPLNGGSPIRFRPYVGKVPWHTGVRAFLSQLFPRYGHYCGPNWSSGKDGGSLIWDRRPIDWLDFCCYCHDIGYDTHDQEKLLQADLAFLECLERPHMSTKGDPHVAHLYKTMCTAGMPKDSVCFIRHYMLEGKNNRKYINFISVFSPLPLFESRLAIGKVERIDCCHSKFVYLFSVLRFIITARSEKYTNPIQKALCEAKIWATSG